MRREAGGEGVGEGVGETPVGEYEGKTRDIEDG